MKQFSVSVSDKEYRKGEKLAETLGTTVQELLSTLAIDAMHSIEMQVLEMEKRTKRAAANRQQGLEAMNLVFDSILPEDEVKTDPKKIKALGEELERDRLYNLTVSKKLGRVGTIRQKVA